MFSFFFLLYLWYPSIIDDTLFPDWWSDYKRRATRFSITEQIADKPVATPHSRFLTFSPFVSPSPEGFIPRAPRLQVCGAPWLHNRASKSISSKRRRIPCSPSKPISKSNRPPTSPYPWEFVLLVIIVDRGTLIEKFRPSSDGFWGVSISFHHGELNDPFQF